MGTHEIQILLHEYGLALVFAFVGLQALGAPLPGTTALIVAALFAGTTHQLPIVGVIATGAVAAVMGTSLAFAIGRWRGEPLLLFAGRRLRQSPERVQRLRTQFAAHASAWIFLGRFISGVRNVTGLLAGASGVPFRRFVPVAGAAAGIWALVNALEYYWFGHALAGADTWVQILLIAAGIGWLVISLRFLRRRALRRLRQAPELE